MVLIKSFLFFSSTANKEVDSFLDKYGTPANLKGLKNRRLKVKCFKQKIYNERLNNRLKYKRKIRKYKKWYVNSKFSNCHII